MSKVVVLKNGKAEMTLLPERGGLLRKLTLLDGRGEPVEILWNAHDLDVTGSGWPMGGMPFLFPFAGRVFHEGQPFRYTLEGEVRHMPLHGFAYGVPWRVVTQSDTSVVCQLEDSPGTHLLFPFAFEIRIEYSLGDREMEVKVHIENRGHLGQSGMSMPIAPGWHPFFKMPLRPLSRLDECVLVTSAIHKVRVTPQGTAGKSSPYPEDSTERDGRLSDAMYMNLILANHKAPSITVNDRDSKLALEVTWSPAEAMRYVVLWSRENEGFQCVEPWMSLPDPLAAGHQVRWLDKGESFSFSTVLRLGAL